jgi:hypothetical protein
MTQCTLTSCRAGVVYVFGDKSYRLPKRVIPLRGNGCRRIPHAQRPHTFEILLGPQRSFQFAAADEYEASDWLQAFVQAASGVSILHWNYCASCQGPYCFGIFHGYFPV